jgi:hypothetical protein
LIRKALDWIRIKMVSPRFRIIYRAYWRIKTHPWSVCVGLGAVTTLLLVMLLRGRLAKLLGGLDSGLSAQLSIGVGAALIGLIAVVV